MTSLNHIWFSTKIEITPTRTRRSIFRIIEFEIINASPFSLITPWLSLKLFLKIVEWIVRIVISLN